MQRTHILFAGLSVVLGTAIVVPAVISYAQVGGGGVSDPLFPASSIKLFRNITFGSLPTCSATIQGTLASITDSTAVTWGGTVTGGSNNPALIFCDGTNWTVAGK